MIDGGKPRFLQSISSFNVSLPNASEKDVKGLLFRKQPIHTVRSCPPHRPNTRCPAPAAMLARRARLPPKP